MEPHPEPTRARGRDAQAPRRTRIRLGTRRGLHRPPPHRPNLTRPPSIWMEGMKPGSFDHHSAEFARDPARHWQELRETCPVHTRIAMAASTFCRVMRMCSKADRDVERFSTADDPFRTGVGGLGVTIPPSPVAFGFFELDPPEHLQRRRIYSEWFGPKAIAKRRPAIRATTTRSARAGDPARRRRPCSGRHRPDHRHEHVRARRTSGRRLEAILGSVS